MENEVKIDDFILELKSELKLQNLSAEIKSQIPICSKIIFCFTNYLLNPSNQFNINNTLILFNNFDIEYIKKLDKNQQKKIIEEFLEKNQIPIIIISDNSKLDNDLISIINKKNIPVYSSELSATTLISKLHIYFSIKFSPHTLVHGVLMEVYGIGILMTGKSGIGKSETALELIERGHRLIADDIIEINVSENNLIGKGTEQIKHHMEIRGLGIINIKSLYGISAIKESTVIDAIIKLEEWSDNVEYDRLGLEENKEQILDIEVPKYVIPVKIGRNLATIIEVAAMNQRLKKMGYFSAKEFNKKLLNWIQQNENIIK
ncbi:MAG TPA: HPr(Ser) kinase/phosphatase [bacterium]|nr:HPr(Ser) kinase/phosphatase [bacterium]HOL48515.1 HPr(Ser) kinase/phosphatase [bacterium]HPQ19052.1 HPr(Ser) kinase/phosphatase [bacterium]